MKKKGVKYWKKKAWVEFSKYIRLRDTNKLGCECYTCGQYKDYKKMHAGHFQPGRHNIFIFDERQVHAQCPGCNTFNRGNWPAYLKRMKQDYGEEEVQKMLDDRGKIKKFKPYELEEIYKKYKAKNESTN
jgi:hypothetical protein